MIVGKVVYLRIRQAMDWNQARKLLTAFPIEGGIRYLPTIVCADGFEMSVQASKFHYSTPRATIAFDQYASYEVGFPTHWQDFNADHTNGDVLGYVPSDVISAVIEKHGGVASWYFPG